MADMSQLYSYESLHRNPKFAAEEQKPNPMGERFLVDSQMDDRGCCCAPRAVRQQNQLNDPRQ
jgi:hypothetical protein